MITWIHIDYMCSQPRLIRCSISAGLFCLFTHWNNWKSFLLVTFKVVFGFNQHATMADIESDIAGSSLIGGPCNTGAALSQSLSALFTDDSKGRRRVLVVLMAGQSSDDVSNPSWSLKLAGVRLIAIGIGPSIDQSQLKQMVFDSSYFLTIASFGELLELSGGTTALISQGIEMYIHFFFFQRQQGSLSY